MSYNFSAVKTGKIEDRKLISKNCEVCGLNYFECNKCHNTFRDIEHFDAHVCSLNIKGVVNG